MKILLPSMLKWRGWFVAACLGLLGYGPAFGATYNMLLKPQGSTTPVTCASGGVTFNKTTSGSFPLTAVIFLQDASPGVPCLGMPAGMYMGSLNIIVENVTLNGEDQGPNVVGLSGTITSMADATSSFTFSYGAGSASTANPVRPLNLAPLGGTASIGSYYLYNSAGVGPTAQALPEPGVFWLVGLALAALGMVRVAARHRR